MTYIMSDIHGHYDKYLKMLEKINPQESDTVYVLGDCADRGPDGVKIWLDIMERKNVVCLLGNHEDFALRDLTEFVFKDEPSDDADPEDYAVWVTYNGGDVTVEAFKKLDRKTQERVLAFLGSLPFYKEIEVNGRKYLLAHSVPEDGLPDEITDEWKWEFIWGWPYFDRQYDKNVTVVIGHTPTRGIEGAEEGRIWKGNGFIDVDCGAGFGFPLGCICLENGEEFYVE